MPELFIFDRDDNLLTILSNEAEGACPFWRAPFREELNKGSTFSFSTVGDHEDSQHIMPGNQVAFFDKDGALRLYVINEPEDTLTDSGANITAVCQPAMNELNRKAILDIRPYNTTLKVATERVLVGSRWKVGEIAELGINSINHYDTYALPAIQENINTWGGELRDRIEFDGNKITGRFIDILPRRGADTGKRWEDDKDIVSMTRTILFDPVTAIVGRGSSLEATDEEGEATGGYTRKISFKDVEWKVSNGDSVDKPKGQEWVGDPDALSKYGLLGEDGKRLHLEEIYENSEIEDPAELLRASYEYLQERNKVAANYTMDVFLLEEMSGYEHEKARLGDSTFAITHAFAKPIEIEARIIVYEYDVADPENTGTVEMGSFIDLHPDLDRFDQIEADLGKVKEDTNKPITDGKFPNIIPPQPTNVIASGLFQSVLVEWDYVSKSYIANYEVYASQVQGFTPDISNLVFKGKTSVFTHKVATNQQWYYRVRAVNTHGNASPFSVEVAAETARIITDDILFGAINAKLLADLAVEAEKLAHQSVTAQAIAALAVGNAAIQNLAVSNSKIDNLAVGEAQIQNLAVTNAKIANLAVDNAKISDLSADKIKVGTLRGIELFGNRIEGGTIIGTSITGSYFYNEGEDGWVRIGNGRISALNFFVNGDGAFHSTTGNVVLRSPDDYVFLQSPKEVRVTKPRTYDEFVDFRAGEIIAENGIYNKGTYKGDNNTLFGSDGGHVTLRSLSWEQVYLQGSEVNCTAPADPDNYIQMKASSFRSMNGAFLGTGDTTFTTASSSGLVALRSGADSQPVYVQGNEIRATLPTSASTYVPMRASAFPTGSLAEFKEDIKESEVNALEIIDSATLYEYVLKNDKSKRKRLGLVIGEGYNTPSVVIDGDGVEQYLMNSYEWKAIQELHQKVKVLENEIAGLKSV